MGSVCGFLWCNIPLLVSFKVMSVYHWFTKSMSSPKLTERPQHSFGCETKALLNDSWTPARHTVLCVNGRGLGEGKAGLWSSFLLDVGTKTLRFMNLDNKRLFRFYRFT